MFSQPIVDALSFEDWDQSSLISAAGSQYVFKCDYLLDK